MPGDISSWANIQLNQPVNYAANYNEQQGKVYDNRQKAIENRKSAYQLSQEMKLKDVVSKSIRSNGSVDYNKLVIGGAQAGVGIDALQTAADIAKKQQAAETELVRQRLALRALGISRGLYDPRASTGATEVDDTTVITPPAPASQPATAPGQSTWDRAHPTDKMRQPINDVPGEIIISGTGATHTKAPEVGMLSAPAMRDPDAAEPVEDTYQQRLWDLPDTSSVEAAMDGTDILAAKASYEKSLPADLDTNPPDYILDYLSVQNIPTKIVGQNGKEVALTTKQRMGLLYDRNARGSVAPLDVTMALGADNQLDLGALARLKAERSKGLAKVAVDISAATDAHRAKAQSYAKGGVELDIAKATKGDVISSAKTSAERGRQGVRSGEAAMSTYDFEPQYLKNKDDGATNQKADAAVASLKATRDELKDIYNNLKKDPGYLGTAAGRAAMKGAVTNAMKAKGMTLSAENSKDLDDVYDASKGKTWNGFLAGIKDEGLAKALADYAIADMRNPNREIIKTMYKNTAMAVRGSDAGTALTDEGKKKYMPESLFDTGVDFFDRLSPSAPMPKDGNAPKKGDRKNGKVWTGKRWL